MEVIELVHKRVQAAQRGMGEHLAVDELSAHENLRAIARDEIHAIGHRLEECAQRVVTTARRGDKANARAIERANEVECFRGNLRVFVKQRAVHVAGNEFDVFIRFHMRASFRLAPEPFGRLGNSSWCSHSTAPQNESAPSIAALTPI